MLPPGSRTTTPSVAEAGPLSGKTIPNGKHVISDDTPECAGIDLGSRFVGDLSVPERKSPFVSSV
jgi:hypothetical protein